MSIKEDNRMTRTGFTGSRACVVLLAAVFIFAVFPSVLAAAQPASADLSLPPSCNAFLTIRVADLFTKFGAKEGSKFTDIALLDSSLAPLGIGPPIGLTVLDVERVTLVGLPGLEAGGIMMLHGAKPLPKKAFLAACLPEAKKVKHAGRILHVNGTRAICFVNDSLLVAGEKAAVKQFFNRGETPAASATFKDALAQAGNRDVVFYGNIKALPEDEVTRVLSLNGVETVLATLNIDNNLTADLRVQCADEKKATDLAKSVKGVINIFRGQLALGAGLKDARSLLPAPAAPKEFESLPWELFRLAEKSLADAFPESDGKCMSVSVAIPIDAKTLRTALERCTPWLWAQGLRGPLPLFGSPQGKDGLAQANPPRMEPAEWEPTTVPMPGEAPPAPLQQVKGTEAIQATAPVKLTVANVRKEEALLFTLAANGKLTFVKKVPAGEAVDVEASTGQRWVAVFTDRPAGESFVTTQVAENWLLR
jgi:hypothetical protein